MVINKITILLKYHKNLPVQIEIFIEIKFHLMFFFAYLIMNIQINVIIYKIEATVHHLITLTQLIITVILSHHQIQFHNNFQVFASNKTLKENGVILHNGLNKGYL